MRKYRLKKMVILFMAAMLFTGCKKGIPSVSEVKEVDGYELSEIMIFVATEKNRYEKIYTDQVWSVEVKEGVNMQSYLLNQIKTFLEDMKTMNLLAEEKEIVLTSTEQDQLRQLSQTYFQGLTEDDIAYMQVTQEDVLTMYQEYHLANKLVNELTGDVDLEVSDDEAKVIQIQQIKLEDEETAGKVYELVTAENADFEALAKEYSVDQDIEQRMSRGGQNSEVEKAAFSLSADQISEVIKAQDSYYIIKCINEYDEAATMENKEYLSKEKKNQAFLQIYEQFHVTNRVTFSDDLWNQIVFSEGDKTTTTNFYELYQEYFPN